MAAEWYYKVRDTEFGPIPASEMVKHAAEGKITAESQVRKGDGSWVPASRVAGLFDRAVPTRPTMSLPPSSTETLSDSPEDHWVSTFTPLVPVSASGKFEVIDEAEGDGFKVEILCYPKLGGAKDHQTAANIYFADRAGMRLKQVRITLSDGEAIAESGALHFMLGQIQMESKIGGVSGLGKAMMNKFVTKEAAIIPRYRGTGQIYLEPSFSHFLVHRLSGDEVIAEKGMFCCGQGSLEVGSAIQKNVSSALFGGEGLFQTRIKGLGICVFESPVPADEVLKIDLKDDTLRVDGNFALMRSGRIEYSVERSTRSLVGSLTSGEGLLQTFRGTGSVWLAPTQEIYEILQTSGMTALKAAPRSSNTAT
jgi:uncharacterized protein (AIM24 family)